MISNTILLILFLITSWSDYKEKEISITVLSIFAFLGIICNLIFHHISLTSLLCGVLIGLFCLLVSLSTNEALGMGDGYLFMVSGIYLGGIENIKLLLFSLMFSSCFSVFYTLYCKDIKRRIPFVPFILSSYIFIIYIDSSHF